MGPASLQNAGRFMFPIKPKFGLLLSQQNGTVIQKKLGEQLGINK